MKTKLTTPVLTLALSLAVLSPQKLWAIAGNDSGRFADSKDQGCEKTPGGPGSLPSNVKQPGDSQATCIRCQQEGMPVWGVSEPYINLWIADEPLGYTTSSGQRMSFRWTYQQREYPWGDWGLRELDGAKKLPIRIRDQTTASSFTMTNAAWCHNWWSEIVFWDNTYETTELPYPEWYPFPPATPVAQCYPFSSGYEGLLFSGDGGTTYFNGSNANAPLGPNKIIVQLIATNSVGGPEVPFMAAGSGGIYGTNNTIWVNNPVFGFRVFYPDGSQDVYGYVKLRGNTVSCPYQYNDPRCYNTNGNHAAHDFTTRAYLTQRIDPQGRTTLIGYSVTGGGYPEAVVGYVVDPDGRTNTYYYNTNNYYQLQAIVDPYGRTNSFTWDSTQGTLSSITDAAGLTSSFQYQPAVTTVVTNYGTNSINYQFTTSYSGWITNLTTPYGSTTFTFVQQQETNGQPTDYVSRAMLATEPEGAHKLFYYLHKSSLLSSSVSSNQVPTVPSYLFDSGNWGSSHPGLNYRNSFYWGRRQFANLPSGTQTALINNLGNALSGLNLNNLQLARLQHWLQDTDTVSTTEYVSSQVEPSPDLSGTTAGARTWFDYASKDTSNPQNIGTQVLPGCVARLLPEGTTNYVSIDYTTAGYPMTRYESFTASPNAVGVRTISYSYAANGVDLNSITESPNTVSFAYNTNHQIKFITNALAQVSTLTWDPNSANLTGFSVPSGLSATLSYYASNSLSFNGGYVSNITLSGIGRSLTFTYTNGQVATVLDDLGLKLTNTWDAMDRLTSTLFPDTTYVSNLYTKLDVTGQKDRLGYWTYYGYDHLQHLTSITNALTNVTQLSWCECGALMSIIDALNNTTTLNYNNQGLLTNVSYPDGSSLYYTFDNIGRLSSVADGTNRTLSFGYNNQGLATSATNSIGRVWQVIYDWVDRPTNITDAAGVTVTNVFDVLNRLLTRSWPTGGGTNGFLWSTNGLLAYTNQDGKVTWFGRNAAGWVLGVTNANSELTRFAYNSLGEVTDLWDGNSHNTHWNYDVYGRLTNMLDHLSHEVVHYSYDADGQVTNRSTPQFGNTGYTYDPVGNLKTVISSQFTNIYTFDPLSRLTNVLDNLGNTAFGYTAIGQLQTEKGPWTSDTLTYGYAQRLRQSVSLTSPSGTWSQTYGYDSAWRLQTLSSPAGSFGYGYTVSGVASPAALVRSITLPNTSWTTNHFDGVGRLDYTALINNWGFPLDAYNYVYDFAGQRTGITRDLGLSTNTVSVVYDPIGQITNWTAKEWSGTPRLNEQLGFKYDAAGNLFYLTNGSFLQSFAVDTLNQLTNVTDSGAFTENGATPTPATALTVNSVAGQTYADLTFARTNITNIVNGLNSFTNIEQNIYAVKATNNLAVTLSNTVALLYDANGNLTNDGTRWFTYDTENRLITNWVTAAWKSEFVYDGLGRRRIERDYNWQAGTWNKTNEIHFIYDGWLIVQERDANNNVLVNYTRGLDLSNSRQSAGGIGGLLARSDLNGSTFYHADASGNITALIDGNQNVQARYEYSPFGRLVGKWGALADLNEMQFSSMPVHRPSGLIEFPLRPTYDPTLGRFLTRDPIGVAGGVNLYGFVGNNPLTAVDPLGLNLLTSVGDALFGWIGNLAYVNPAKLDAIESNRQFANNIEQRLIDRGLIDPNEQFDFQAAQRALGVNSGDQTAGDLQAINAVGNTLGSAGQGYLTVASMIVVPKPTACPASAAESAAAEDLAAGSGEAGEGTLTAAEQAEIQAIADRYNTTIDVVGSRAAGAGRNVDTSLPVGKGADMRSDIDFRIDATHPQAADLIRDLKNVGNGAGSASTKYSTTTRPTTPPYIRFTPNN